jgi:hypothetical protein
LRLDVVKKVIGQTDVALDRFKVILEFGILTLSFGKVVVVGGGGGRGGREDDAFLEESVVEVEEGRKDVLFVLEVGVPELDEGEETRVDQRVVLLEEEQTLDLLEELLGTDLGEEGEVSFVAQVREEVKREGDHLRVVYQ